MLSFVRELIALRRDLGEGFELLDAPAGVIAFRRDGHTVAINTSAEPAPAPLSGSARIQTAEGALQDGLLAPHAGAIAVD